MRRGGVRNLPSTSVSNASAAASSCAVRSRSITPNLASSAAILADVLDGLFCVLSSDSVVCRGAAACRLQPRTQLPRQANGKSVSKHTDERLVRTQQTPSETRDARSGSQTSRLSFVGGAVCHGMLPGLWWLPAPKEQGKVGVVAIRMDPSENERRGTNLLGSVFDKRVSSRLALEWARFMKQKVELGYVAEFREDLEESIPIGKLMSTCDETNNFKLTRLQYGRGSRRITDSPVDPLSGMERVRL